MFKYQNFVAKTETYGKRKRNDDGINEKEGENEALNNYSPSSRMDIDGNSLLSEPPGSDFR